MIVSKLEVKSPIKLKGIYYIGQYGTSGYASAAKGYLYHYFSLGVPITWDPLYFDDSRLEDDDPYNVVVKSLINNPISYYDVVIMHSTPDLWPRFRVEKQNIFNNKVVIGYCVWETNKVPEEWVKCINNTVHELWVPSTYNQTAFKESGVTKPIRVVPHVLLNIPLPAREDVTIKDSLSGNIIENNKYTFYTIGELTPRKGIEDLIHCFCKSFTKDNNVRLIIKTHFRNYSWENINSCREKITNLLSNYPDAPEVIGLLDNMTNKEILGLHSIGNCYVSLTKSEGFGLTIFDAHHYGKKIIATGYGGHVDFLGKGYNGLVSYKLDKIGDQMKVISDCYDPDHEWAYPNLGHAIQLMKKAYEN